MNTSKDYIPERAKKTNKLIADIHSTLNSYGYSEIFLPLYEYYEILKHTTWDFRDENIIRFIDRNSGKSMVLRPDFTPQVCRVVSTYMKGYPLPLRLQYKGRVFRNVNMDRGLKSEKYQVGFENFGSSELYGDLELLNIVDSTMNNLKIDDYQIVIGDQGFLKLLLEKFNDSDYYLKLLTEKNMDEIKKFLSNKDIPDNISRLLKYLPYAFGKPEILDKIYELSTFNSLLSERTKYLKELFSRLPELGVDTSKLIIDMGETRGLGYYTGINLDIINDKTGSVLGGGGRYDSLMSKFGQNMTACGLAYNIEEIMPLYKHDYESEPYDYLIVGKHNFIKAEQLRKEGYKVFWVEEESSIKEIKERYKFKNITM